MSATHGQERSARPTTSDALVNPRRRWIVEILDTEGALDVEDLATRVAAREREVDPNDVDGDDHERTMVELLHVDLPVLADAGAIEYDDVERTARPTDEASDVADESESLPPSVIDALANGRRRRTLTILNHRVTPLSVTDLACDVASEELSVPLDAVPDDYRDAVHVALHHSHLPKLADAGLVHYDASAHEVERSTHLLGPISDRIATVDRQSTNTHGER